MDNKNQTVGESKPAIAGEEHQSSVCTPLPWRLRHIDEYIFLIGSDDSCVADIDPAWPAKCQANAAFVVKAVNNHQKLVDALKRINSWFENQPGSRLEDLPQDFIQEALKSVGES